MNNVEILEKAFREHNCENIIARDGKLYAAILSAMSDMQMNTRTKLKASVNAAMECIVPSEESVVQSEPVLNESFEKVKRISKLVRSEIDFSKRGATAESILRFLKEFDGATFTELNMFYKNIKPEEYNSARDRGGSLTHWLNDLQVGRKRVYSNKYCSIYKNNGKWYVD